MKNQGAKTGLVADLMEAGYTEYEAKVYLALLAHHPASAYTISQHSGVPHSRVYEVARRLISKGFAASTGTQPEMYSPLSPDDLVEKLTRDTAELASRLGEALASVDFTPDFDPVWNITTTDEALNQLREIIDAAQRRLYVGIFREDFAVVKDALRGAHERGVELFMLVYGETEIDFGRHYIHERSHLDAISSLGRTLECTADTAVCITGNLRDHGPTRVVWTKNFGLVFSIENYLIHDLFIHEIQTRLGPDFERRFGPNMMSLRRMFHHLEM